MANDGVPVSATAHIRITKLDDNNNIIAVEEHDVDLTLKEAEELWHLQQQG